MSKINIFIAHTPFQAYMAENILKHEHTSFHQEYNFLIHTIPVNNDSRVFQKLLFVDKRNLFKKNFYTYIAKRGIEEALYKYSEVNVFISHTSPVLDNYCFYYLKDHNTHLYLNLYYEGILYFYDYREKYNRKTHLVRKIYSYLAGMTYFFNPQILPIQSSKISRLYTPFPKYNLDGFKGEIVDISPKKIDVKKVKYKYNTCLILGGSLNELTEKETESLYLSIFKRIREISNIKHVLFKGHHSDKTGTFYRVAKKEGIGYDDITQDKAIESILDQYLPRYIYSYPSSALINIKGIFANDMKIETFYILKKKENMEFLNRIFEELDIKLNLI